MPILRSWKNFAIRDCDTTHMVTLFSIFCIFSTLCAVTFSSFLYLTLFFLLIFSQIFSSISCFCYSSHYFFIFYCESILNLSPPFISSTSITHLNYLSPGIICLPGLSVSRDHLSPGIIRLPGSSVSRDYPSPGMIRLPGPSVSGLSVSGIIRLPGSCVSGLSVSGIMCLGIIRLWSQMSLGIKCLQIFK